jgi:hypothetical protein
MKIVISFLIGVWFTWGWVKQYDGSVFDLWTEAYGVGKDDGYVLGRNDITFEDFSFEQLEAKCMFLYADKGTVFGTKKKGGK